MWRSDGEAGYPSYCGGHHPASPPPVDYGRSTTLGMWASHWAKCGSYAENKVASLDRRHRHNLYARGDRITQDFAGTRGISNGGIGLDAHRPVIQSFFFLATIVEVWRDSYCVASPTSTTEENELKAAATENPVPELKCSTCATCQRVTTAKRNVAFFRF